MTEAIILKPEKSAVILIDMINAAGVDLFHNHPGRPDNADALKTISDLGGGGVVPMLAGTPAREIINELRPQSQDYVVVKSRFSAFYGANLDGIRKVLRPGQA